MENKIMPKEIKEQVEVTKYVCSNCGAKHKNTFLFRTCAITGEEVCTDCATQVYLAKIDDVDGFGTGDEYEVYFNPYSSYVKKELAPLNKAMLEYEQEDYLKVVDNLYKDFCKKMKKAHEAYLQGKIRDFDKLI